MNEQPPPPTPAPTPKKLGRRLNSKSRPLHETLMHPDIHSPRRSIPKNVFYHHAKWNNSEKRHLIRALRQCATEFDINKVYRMVPTRRPEEVEAEVNRLRNAVGQRGTELQAPIETWLDFCEEMIHYEEEDHSKCLGRAMSIVANYENFEPVKKGAPDYKNLYKYLAAVLNRIEPPKLSPIESLVVLDLMHSLVDVLSETDTTTQRDVMKWKFSMLNCKVDINNLREAAERTRRALSNDFPEGLLKSIPGRSPPGPKPSTSQEGEVMSMVSYPKSNKEMTSNPVHTATSASSSSRSSGDTTPSVDNDGAIDVMNVTNKELSNIDCDAKSVEHTSSRTPGDKTPAGSKDEACVVINDSSSDNDEPPKKKMCGSAPGMGQNKGNQPLQKPLLYTLNPFCVPVEILKLPKGKQKRKLGVKFL